MQIYEQLNYYFEKKKEKMQEVKATSNSPKWIYWNPIVMYSSETCKNK
jgi:hypothetical protein